MRAAVGDEKLTYLGYSYGTTLGSTYAELFPDKVRAMVLDANINPSAFTTSVQAAMSASNADSDLVIRKFLELCGRAGPASSAAPGSAGDALDRASRDPV